MLVLGIVTFDRKLISSFSSLKNLQSLALMNIQRISRSRQYSGRREVGCGLMKPIELLLKCFCHARQKLAAECELTMSMEVTSFGDHQECWMWFFSHFSAFSILCFSKICIFCGGLKLLLDCALGNSILMLSKDSPIWSSSSDSVHSLKSESASFLATSKLSLSSELMKFPLVLLTSSLSFGFRKIETPRRFLSFSFVMGSYARLMSMLTMPYITSFS